MGCGRRRGGGADTFLCGSDNRTYSSLCRLDLHNCVRRPRRPVALACRGFCPCPPAPKRAPAAARDRDPAADYDQSVSIYYVGSVYSSDWADC